MLISICGMCSVVSVLALDQILLNISQTYSAGLCSIISGLVLVCVQ